MDLENEMPSSPRNWRLNMTGFSLPDVPGTPPLVSRFLGRGRGRLSLFPCFLYNNSACVACLMMPRTPTYVRMQYMGRIGKVLPDDRTSMAVIASTLDSLLDLLSGFILWFTSYAMKKPNQYRYPIGKNRMQPVGIIVFASVMGTLGLQVLLESGRQLISKDHPAFDRQKMIWMVGSMASVTIVKFVLMLYCRSFNNQIVRAYAQDHFFDVMTNSIGLASSLLAVKFYWWMDPVGAILVSSPANTSHLCELFCQLISLMQIALYTIGTWAKTVVENVRTLIGKTAPSEYLTKLTYLIWNHDEHIRHIDTVRAYTFGSHYFVEVDIVLPADMPLSQAHDIGETLQQKLEQLTEVERAFVHVDFEFTHRPEHKTTV
ncbi:hypothetical protein B296_00028280 [Ensete ventricosum]|uniref:Uncharacterized protein n=1 Tax=Ensete ventricosum TaxID=4639 RepID=A0A427AGA3_ENSVE|nr:hypothetical protein B296_00028280 [Ensete ventricosum]